MMSLSCGMNSNSSCRMNRARIGSPPVSCLIRDFAFLCLGDDDQPSATQGRHRRRMLVVVADGEGLDRRRLGIVAENGVEGVDGGALAVPTRAVGERQGVLPGASRQGVKSITKHLNASGIHTRDGSGENGAAGLTRSP